MITIIVVFPILWWLLDKLASQRRRVLTWLLAAMIAAEIDSWVSGSKVRFSSFLLIVSQYIGHCVGMTFVYNGRIILREFEVPLSYIEPIVSAVITSLVEFLLIPVHFVYGIRNVLLLNGEGLVAILALLLITLIIAICKYYLKKHSD